MVRDLILAAVERRFKRTCTPHRVDLLSDTTARTSPRTLPHPARSRPDLALHTLSAVPKSNGISASSKPSSAITLASTSCMMPTHPCNAPDSIEDYLEIRRTAEFRSPQSFPPQCLNPPAKCPINGGHERSPIVTIQSVWPFARCRSRRARAHAEARSSDATNPGMAWMNGRHSAGTSPSQTSRALSISARGTPSCVQRKALTCRWKALAISGCGKPATHMAPGLAFPAPLLGIVDHSDSSPSNATTCTVSRQSPGRFGIRRVQAWPHGNVLCRTDVPAESSGYDRRRRANSCNRDPEAGDEERHRRCGRTRHNALMTSLSSRAPGIPASCER